jgi:hypothetical protein
MTGNAVVERKKNRELFTPYRKERKMEVKLEIKAEQINEMLSQAVLDSVMEEHIKKMLV